MRFHACEMISNANFFFFYFFNKGIKLHFKIRKGLHP